MYKPFSVKAFGMYLTCCPRPELFKVKKFETQNELFRIGTRKMVENAEKYNLFSIMRSDVSAVEGTLQLLEKHFGL